MEETLRRNLVRLADALADASPRATRPAIGRLALKDNTFFSRMENGDGFTVKTFDRLVRWFSDNWPADLAWPDDIERPASETSSEAASRIGDPAQCHL